MRFIPVILFTMFMVTMLIILVITTFGIWVSQPDTWSGYGVRTFFGVTTAGICARVYVLLREEWNEELY